MKRILLIVFSILILSGCEEQLDILPVGNLTSNEQFATPQGVETALLAVYADQPLYELRLHPIEVYGNMGMGLHISTPEWHLALEGEFTPRLSTDIWERTYGPIATCNYFLYDVEEFDPEFLYEVRREEAIAEARCMRAHRYFRLVRCFGAVPLVIETNMDNWYPERAPVEDVYTQIIEDLTYGMDHLPEVVPGGILSADPNNKEWGRVTKYSAMGLLAKVYMTAPPPLQDYNRAVELLDGIINSRRYSLLPDWGMVFNPDYRANNPESIWPIMWTDAFQGGGTKLAHYSTPDQSWMRPTNEMYNKYEATDTRRDLTILKGWKENFFWKFMQGLAGDERDKHPWYILRYPDVLLTKAEALTVLDFQGNKQQIIDLINQVRQRANASLWDPADFTDQTQMINAILDEMHRELYFEVQYWFAMKRNGIDITFERQGFGPVTPENQHKFLLPLPPVALRKNKNLYQNPGYGTE